MGWDKLSNCGIEHRWIKHVGMWRPTLSNEAGFRHRPQVLTTVFQPFYIIMLINGVIHSINGFFFRFWYQQEDGRTDARVSAMMQQGNVHHLRRCYTANMGLDHVILLVRARFSLLPADLNITSRAVLSAMFNFVGHYIQEMLPHEFQDWLLINNLELRPTLSILNVSPLYRYISIFWLVKYVQIPLNHQFSSSLVLQIP